MEGVSQLGVLEFAQTNWCPMGLNESDRVRGIFFANIQLEQNARIKIDLQNRSSLSSSKMDCESDTTRLP